MGNIIIGTNTVTMDEPCYGLHEVHKQSPGSRGFHRYQCIQVIRNDQVVELIIDMGDARDFKADNQFFLPGGYQQKNGKYLIAETVGRLRDIADYLRNRPALELKMPTHNLMEGYYEHCRRRDNGNRN